MGSRARQRIGEGIGVVVLDEWRHLRSENQRPVGDQQSDAELDRVDRGQQVQVDQEVEDVAEIARARSSGVNGIHDGRTWMPASRMTPVASAMSAAV